MNQPRAYRFPLANRAKSSIDESTKLKDIIIPRSLGQATLSMNLDRVNAERVPVFQRRIGKSTAYFVVPEAYDRLWKIFSPKDGDQQLDRTFVVPEHRLIAIKIFHKEIPTDLDPRCHAILSPLRQLEIRQGIHFGLKRLQEASDARAYAALSATFERWNYLHGIRIACSSTPPAHPLLAKLPNGVPIRTLSAGPIQVVVVPNAEWSNVCQALEISGRQFEKIVDAPPRTEELDLTPPQITCVTSEHDLLAAAYHLRDAPAETKNLETALAAQALCEFLRSEPVEQLRTYLTNLPNSEVVPLAEPDQQKREDNINQIVLKLDLLRREFENPLSTPADRGRLWAGLLGVFGVEIRKAQSLPQNFQEALENLHCVVNEHDFFSSVGLPFDLGEIQQDVNAWIAHPSRPRISQAMQARLRGRQLVDDPTAREIIARTKGLGQPAPKLDVQRQRQLINHQSQRLQPGPVLRNTLITDLRAHSLFPIPDHTGHDIKNSKARLSAATYLHVLFNSFPLQLELVDLGQVHGELLVRFHGRTQAVIEEYPGFRFTLEDPTSNRIGPLPVGICLDAVHIPVVQKVPPTITTPLVCYDPASHGPGPRFHHPAFLNLAMPLGTVGLYVSTCSRFVFSRTRYQEKTVQFLDENDTLLTDRSELETALTSCRGMDRQTRSALKWQIADYFRDKLHFTYLPSIMNLALEPLDIE